MSLLIAGIREAAKRIEDAQRTFARPVTAPLVPPKPRPAALDVPPPLPGPPPLPRRDQRLMELGFEFQYPWALLLLALLPLYSWLRGRVGKAAALTYPDTSLLDGLGRPVREQSGRLRAFLRLLTAALLVIALAGRGRRTRKSNARPKASTS
ncbi:hypothetical protein EMGBS6_11670 [Opitutia bacterium]|nr:hypothetical protein EMGBS6_11670 [Opitutae bacterium]